jgi:hypothetical protein
MAGAMGTVMDDLVDPSFWYRLSGKKHLAVFAAIAHAAGATAAKSGDCSIALS